MTQLQQAIAAIKHGDKETGKRLLAQVVRDEPRNEEAWLWLTYAVDDIKQKRDCLERVLSLNPYNKQAQKVLESLDAQRTIAISKPKHRQAAGRFEKPAPERTKKCPHCAESIKAEATVCRHCGYDFKKARTKRIRSILLAVCAVAVCACCALTFSGFNSGTTVHIPTRPSISETSVPRLAPATYEVRYEVVGIEVGDDFVGTPPTFWASMTWENSQGGTEQGDYSLPFEKTFAFEKGDFVYISAQNSEDWGFVTCRIWVNGTKWRESTSRGAYSIATCSGLIGED